MIDEEFHFPKTPEERIFAAYVQLAYPDNTEAKYGPVEVTLSDLMQKLKTDKEGVTILQEKVLTQSNEQSAPFPGITYEIHETGKITLQLSDAFFNPSYVTRSEKE